MRTMRTIAGMAGQFFARLKPPTEAEIADRARDQRFQKVATAYESAIARELAARGRAAHLYRTEGDSPAAREAAQDYRWATSFREQLGDMLFQI
jgi:hypothetical protein